MGVLSLDTEKYQREVCREEAINEWLDSRTIEETKNLLSDGRSFSNVSESFIDDQPFWKFDSILLKVYLAFTKSSMSQRVDREQSIAELIRYLEKSIQKVALAKAKAALKERQNDFVEPDLD